MINKSLNEINNLILGFDKKGFFLANLNLDLVSSYNEF